MHRLRPELAAPPISWKESKRAYLFSLAQPEKTGDLILFKSEARVVAIVLRQNVAIGSAIGPSGALNCDGK
jgi:hypothetical protein